MDLPQESLGAGLKHGRDRGVPTSALGYAAAAPARARLDRARLRRAVLAFCVVAGVSVIVPAMSSRLLAVPTPSPAPTTTACPTTSR